MLMLLMAAAATILQLAGPGEQGTRIRVMGAVHDRSGKPVAGASVHVYQTDASGRYTPDKPMDEAHARLSGTVITDAEGRFDVHTIRPGGYTQAVRLGGADRHIPAHIHMDVSAAGHPVRRAQVVFEDDPLLQEPYWRDWVKSLKQPVIRIETQGGEQVARVLLALD